MSRHINEKGLAIIKEREGFYLEKYFDDNDGWTVGWGHLITGKEPFPCDIITAEQAEWLIRNDVSEVEKQVSIATQNIPLSENAFSALCSFVYNIGFSKFINSTLLKKLKTGDYQGAADQFGKWKYDDKVEKKGLVIRRAKERSLFLET
jgi:lysozyme